MLITPQSLAAMLVLAVLWGLSIPVTKLGLVTLPPLTLTALRFAIAVPLLLLLAIGRKRIPARSLGRVVALGIIGIGIGQVAQTFGIEGTSASVGTILSATIPLFIVVLAAIRLKQRFSARQWAGLLAAFLGMVLVASSQESGSAQAAATTWIGVFWMLLSSVAIAFYYVWSVELTQEYGVETVVALSTLAGFVALLPWTGWEMLRHSPKFTVSAVAAATYLGILVTAIGLYLWLYILRRVSAGVAASVQFLQPVVGIAAAAAMFGDPLGVWFAAGVLLILSGLGLTVVQNRKSARLASNSAE